MDAARLQQLALILAEKRPGYIVPANNIRVCINMPPYVSMLLDALAAEAACTPQEAAQQIVRSALACDPQLVYAAFAGGDSR